MIILKGRALKATAVSHLDQKADAAYKRTAAMQMFYFIARVNMRCMSRSQRNHATLQSFITLAASNGKLNVKVWRQSVRLSVPSAYSPWLTSVYCTQCATVSVHLGATISLN